MARIPMLSASELDPELADMVDAEHRTPLELGNMRIYGHRPELAKAYAQFAGAMKAPGLLPRRLLELVRLRVAFHNQCRSCMAIRYADAVNDGVTEDLVCQLQAPDEATDLTDAERAALRFADLMAADHWSIDDDTFTMLREYFADAEIVELGMTIALCVGFGRLSMAWDMVDELPERFRDGATGTVTPWGSDAIVVS
jgi:AhpD family alkylhydroperoxidase